jgi:hypothetical protein
LGLLPPAKKENHIENGEHDYESFQNEGARLTKTVHHGGVEFAEGMQILVHQLGICGQPAKIP